jgi:hypothetical protein
MLFQLMKTQCHQMEIPILYQEIYSLITTILCGHNTLKLARMHFLNMMFLLTSSMMTILKTT